ncbi:MAG: N-acetyl-gamma-glutamyl-phosphate reductase [Neisseriaceae bacterium]|nr:MAG: N-acetyl-gamma-glutamyl-phosphate reductase [Neisseriaceae bacterium]
MKKIKTSIIGASGYTGVELIRLLSAHPQVELTHLVSETYQQQELIEVFPHLAHLTHLKFVSLDLTQLAQQSDVVFLALPHTKAAAMAKELLQHNCKVIDLSADLRLNDGATYEQWYQHPAADSALLAQAVYGLAEIGYREQIAGASLIANPGCYPTATLLALAPLLNNKLLNLSAAPVIIDAKSGVSGAGRSLSLATHFCETSNNFSAYQVGGIHRHTPEIEQELGKLAGKELMVQFTPHLIPIPRGLMVTAYCPLNSSLSLKSIKQFYTEYYQDSYFVQLNNQERTGVKAVIGTNFCQISLHLDLRTNYLVVVSVIDNLLKGASGQAVQNMNLMYQLPETIGLTALAVYP